jgi:hypothetical protein
MERRLISSLSTSNGRQAEQWARKRNSATVQRPLPVPTRTTRCASCQCPSSSASVSAPHQGTQAPPRRQVLHCRGPMLRPKDLAA